MNTEPPPASNGSKLVSEIFKEGGWSMCREPPRPSTTLSTNALSRKLMVASSVEMAPPLLALRSPGSCCG